MKQISKKGWLGKEVSNRDAVFVGWRSTNEAFTRRSGLIEKKTATKSLPADWETVVNFLKPYHKGLKKVVYEAGQMASGNGLPPLEVIQE